MSHSYHMTRTTPFTVLILAAGSGNRFAHDVPKQYAPLCGSAVLKHTIARFLSHPAKPNVFVVIDPEHEELYYQKVHDPKMHQPIYGGKTRKESCYRGLCELSQRNIANNVLVHDGARPFISHKEIDAVLKELQTYHSVTLGMPISETLRRADQQGHLNETINRDHAWSIQTPQGFILEELLKAHEQFLDQDTFTDDCGVMEAAGHQTKIIPGSRQNIKITWPEDLREAEKIMTQHQITVIGQGYDVHAFGEEEVQHIRLGGIDVPHDRPLKAHSDGDVVLHALTDAILGAIGEGDIGLHFPPSDTTWKDKDSRYFLEAACNMLYQTGGTINNVDVTLICERPKLTPVRDDMRAQIAKTLKIPPQQVNVKATTTEKLGFTGRSEGIACQAAICANINRYDDATE